MAVSSGVDSRVLFIGLSGDVKPDDNIDFAAKFYEYDTGKTYIWTGSTNLLAPAQGQWVEYLPLYPAAMGFVTQPL